MNNNTNSTPPAQANVLKWLAGFPLHVLLPLIILAGGILLTVYLLKTSPRAEPRRQYPKATLVEVRPLHAEPQQTILSAMGEVVPARDVEIRPRVAGEIIGLAEEFLPGGYFLADQNMLTIDPSDYQLIIEQLESEARKADSDLALEMGNQRIAAKELALLGEQVSDQEKELILRQPQLTKLQATRDAAQARLAKARLDLARTTLRAPFNGIIQSRLIDLGAKVNESMILARLVGTDSFWVRLTVPVDQLRWLHIPATTGEHGSEVRIFAHSGNGQSPPRLGHVLRLEAELEEQGRMAQLLVQVDDPLCRNKENLEKSKLLLGAYVRAELVGKTINSAYRIERTHLHDGDTLWLMTKTNTLEIRQVPVHFRARDYVLVTKGINEGERLITSNLASPATGIKLRLQQPEERSAPPPFPAEAKRPQ